MLIDFVSPKSGLPLTRQANKLTAENGEQFPIEAGIPRFVPKENYAAAFGLQWKLYARTQLDSYSGTRISQERFERCLGMPIDSLKDKRVFEAGCGAGRFTELLVRGGAHVHSIDYSVAVEANKENIGAAPNYVVAQANLLTPPFPAESFDIVVCLGVLQHLPSPEDGIKALWRMVKPGGLLVIDHYLYRPRAARNLKYFLYRPILRRMKPSLSKPIVNFLVSIFFPLHWRFRESASAQLFLNRISPCLFYYREYPDLSKAQLYEWTRLDAYDSLTDYYKHFRTPEQIRATLESLGAADIWVEIGGNGVEARCTKPQHA